MVVWKADLMADSMAVLPAVLMVDYSEKMWADLTESR